jgi:hypothetical protein
MADERLPVVGTGNGHNIGQATNVAPKTGNHFVMQELFDFLGIEISKHWTPPEHGRRAFIADLDEVPESAIALSHPLRGAWGQAVHKPLPLHA